MYLFMADITIQTFLFKVVGPGLVSTSPAFVSSSASHPAGPLVGCVVWSQQMKLGIFLEAHNVKVAAIQDSKLTAQSRIPNI